MLYALLNGGAPYLVRDAAYPNIDGAFDENVKIQSGRTDRKSEGGFCISRKGWETGNATP